MRRKYDFEPSGEHLRQLCAIPLEKGRCAGYAQAIVDVPNPMRRCWCWLTGTRWCANYARTTVEHTSARAMRGGQVRQLCAVKKNQMAVLRFNSHTQQWDMPIYNYGLVMSYLS